jgi:uncharacterized membrane protein
MTAPLAASLAALRAVPARVSDRAWDAALVLLALVTRLWGLNYHSVWFDEAVSLAWAGMDLRHTWAVTMQLVEDKHPPVYYTLLHLWQGLLGWFGLNTNDTALRLLGGILGALTVWGILLLARAAGTRAAGGIAGLLVALSPLLVWYSQELRMFQPAATGIVWCAVALWRAWDTPALGRRLLWWGLAVFAMTAALYSYLFSAFMLPAAGLALVALLARTRHWRRFLEGALALLVVGLLFLPLARNAWSVNAAESTPGRAFADFAANLLRLLQNATTWRVAWEQPWLNLSLAFFALLIFFGLLLPWPRTSQTSTFDRVWLWIWLGVPLLVANLMLSRSRSIFIQDRYLLFMAPFILWAVGRGCAALYARTKPLGSVTALLAAGILLAALPPLWTSARARENWRAAAAYILDYRAASPGLLSAVVTHVDYTHLALEWYLRQTTNQDTLPVFFPFGGVLGPDDVDSVIAPPLEGIVEFGAASLWLTQSHLEGVDDNRLVEGWLAQHFPIITEQYPAGVKLSGYMLQGQFDALPALSPAAVFPDAELAPGLRLLACEVMTPAVAARDDDMHPPSGWVHVRLWWKADTPLRADYIATAQMIGPEGVWGDRLHRPTEALRFWPTSTWQPNTIVRDELDVNLNPVTPTGEYPIVIGAADASGAPVSGTVECGRVTVE